MKKLLLLTLACALTASIDAMKPESNDQMICPSSPTAISGSPRSLFTVESPSRKWHSQTKLPPSLVELRRTRAEPEGPDIAKTGISMRAMESSSESEGTLSSSTEELLVPVATKSDKPARTRELLERKKSELSKSLRETEKKYLEIDEQAKYAYGSSVNKDNPDQAQAKIIYEQYRDQCTNIIAELAKLEEQMKTAQYKWFMNRIKHSKPIELQDALKYAIGKYNRPPETWFINNRPPEAWYFNYCLFTREQKMKLIAYAQTIQAKRNIFILVAEGDKRFEGKKPDPKILKKHTKACYVTLLMQEFKGMTVADQQIGSRYFEYQTNP